MWNCRNLSQPPYCELKVILKQGQKDVVLGIRNFLKQAERPTQDHLRLLRTEDYVLKRIIYKLRNQFRSDKGLQSLRQVNTCMKRLQEIDVEKQLRNLLALVDRRFDSEDDEMYLPSRQMLEYHFVRLQGTAALLHQTVQYCQKTFVHARQHMELGNMAAQNLLMLALTSRIWYVCLSLGQYVCEWYRRMFPCLNFVTSTSVKWLSSSTSLPNNLKDWLKEVFGDMGNSDSGSELLESVKAEKAAGNLPSDVGFLHSSHTEDLGEIIRRDRFSRKTDITAQREVDLGHADSSRCNNPSKETSEESLENLSGDTKSWYMEKNEGNESVRRSTKPETKTNVDLKRKKETGSASEETKLDKKDNKKKKMRLHEDDIKEEINIEHNVEANNSLLKQENEMSEHAEVKLCNLHNVKSGLEATVNTFKDFENLLKQIQSRTFEINGIHFEIKKKTAKKILLNVKKWTEHYNNSSDTESMNELRFFKKLRGPLSQMLVDNNHFNGGQLKETPLETSVLSEKGSSIKIMGNSKTETVLKHQSKVETGQETKTEKKKRNKKKKGQLMNSK